jgi:hypothetical protein
MSRAVNKPFKCRLKMVPDLAGERDIFIPFATAAASSRVGRDSGPQYGSVTFEDQREYRAALSSIPTAEFRASQALFLCGTEVPERA